MRRSEIARRVAASLATIAAATGLMSFATLGSFSGTDPFPHSVQLTTGAHR